MSQGKQVLLIEDDGVIQKLITKLCNKRGVQVTAVEKLADIEKALADVSAYDLFFVDMILPEITGWELLQRIKNLPEYNHAPLIVLTGAILSQTEKDKILKLACSVIEKRSFSLALFEKLLDEHLG